MPWRLAPVLAAVALAVVYLATDARGGDLAAHVYRADLFAREGFTIWNGNWYAGHHTPAYSLFFPAVAALLSPQLAGAIGAITAAACFEALMRSQFGKLARIPSLWFGVAVGLALFTSRLPFLLGLGIGLAALLAFQRRRIVVALVLGFLCPLFSPVAGLFLAMAGVAYALAAIDIGSLREQRRLSVKDADRRRLASGLGLAAVALLPTLALTVVVPEGGYQPFHLSPFAVLAPIIACIAFALFPPEQRALRIGALLYAAGTVAAFVLHTPVGNNTVRIGELFAGPLILWALLERARLRPQSRPGRTARVATIVLVVTVAYWSAYPPLQDVIDAREYPRAFQAAYYEPLLEFLDRQGGRPWRVEVAFIKARFETVEIAKRYPIARGWERQLDARHNKLFYEGRLTHRRYEQWLRENGVRFVALAEARGDYSAKREGELIKNPASASYLRPVWRSRDWRVYELRGSHPLVVAEGQAKITAESLGSDDVVLRVRRPGSAVVRVHWSPYWRLRGGCVERDGDWTRVEARRPGRLRLEQSFAPERIVQHGRRCG